MRCSRTTAVVLATVAALLAALLSGCELREGAKSEYGESSAPHDHQLVKIAERELLR